MFNLFKRKFKSEYKRAINKKIVYSDQEVICPRCKQPLLYFPKGNGAEIQCTKKKCIRGDSWGEYGFKMS